MNLSRNTMVSVLPALLLSACSLFGGKQASIEVAEPAPAVVRMASATLQEHNYRCGSLNATLRQLGEGASLTVNGRTWALRPEIAASGAKSVAIDDARTVFWSKGDTAQLELAGAPQPECRLIRDGQLLFRAVGNEPGWRLDVTERALVLLTDYGDTRIVAPGPLVEAMGDLRHYRASTPDGEMSVTVADRVCVDTMSGMSHPAAVELSWQGQILRGCGGDPVQLLLGEPWQVVEIDGRGVADPQRVTLGFGLEGRVAGMAACNRYSGGYALSGEGLQFSQMAGTKMACPTALMDEEQRFHAVLARVQAFGIAADGSLELKSDDRVVMRARRN